MNIVNMKKVGDTYEQDFNPFGEYEYVDDRYIQQEQEPLKIQVAPAVADLQVQIMKNMNDVFDGVDIVFNMTEHFMKRMRRFI